MEWANNRIDIHIDNQQFQWETMTKFAIAGITTIAVWNEKEKITKMITSSVLMEVEWFTIKVCDHKAMAIDLRHSNRSEKSIEMREESFKILWRRTRQRHTIHNNKNIWFCSNVIKIAQMNIEQFSMLLCKPLNLIPSKKNWTTRTLVSNSKKPFGHFDNNGTQKN